MSAIESITDRVPDHGIEPEPPGAFELVMIEHEKRQLGAEFARRCLKALVIAGIVIAVQSVSIVYLVWLAAENKVAYFSTEGGRVQRMFALDQPAFSALDVVAFGSDTIRESFTLDFVHYQRQMSGVQVRFNEKGYNDYYKALTSSNLWTAVVKQRMNLSVSVDPGVVTSKGVIGGLYAYEVQYPVALKLDGQQSSNSAQHYILTLRIQQVDPRQKSNGLEVTQVITSTR